MAKGVQIGSVFTAIGFKVNAKDLDSLQKKMANFRKQLKLTRAATKSAINLNVKGEAKKVNSLTKDIRGLRKESSKSNIKFRIDNFRSTQKMLSIIEKQLKRIRLMSPLILKAGGSAGIQSLTAQVNRLNVAVAKNRNIRVTTTGGVGAVGGGGGSRRSAFSGGVGAGIGSQFGQFSAGVGGVGAAFFTGKAVLEAGQAIEGIRSGLLAAGGGEKGGARAFQFMLDLSDRLGISFKDNTRAFQNFLAASKAVDTPVAESEEIFSSFAEAGRTLNLSTADMGGVMRAVTQIMSKGSVQAEELRGQLGERLPGAVGLMAKALDVTVAQLNKMLEAGEVLASDALPKMAKRVKAFARANGALDKAVNSNLANQERLNNAWFFFKVSIAEAGFMDKMTNMFVKYTKKLVEATTASSGFSQVMEVVIEFIDATIFVVSKLISVFSELPLTLKIIAGLLLAMASPFLAWGAGIFFVVGALEEFFVWLDKLDPETKEWVESLIDLAAAIGIVGGALLVIKKLAIGAIFDTAAIGAAGFLSKVKSISLALKPLIAAAIIYEGFTKGASAIGAVIRGKGIEGAKFDQDAWTTKLGGFIAEQLAPDSFKNFDPNAIPASIGAEIPEFPSTAPSTPQPTEVKLNVENNSDAVVSVAS